MFLHGILPCPPHVKRSHRWIRITPSCSRAPAKYTRHAWFWSVLRDPHIQQTVLTVFVSLGFPPFDPIVISPMDIGPLIALVGIPNFFLLASCMISKPTVPKLRGTRNGDQIQGSNGASKHLQQTSQIRWHLRISAGSVGCHGCKWKCPGCARDKKMRTWDMISFSISLIVCFKCFATVPLDDTECKKSSSPICASNPLWKVTLNFRVLVFNKKCCFKRSRYKRIFQNPYRWRDKKLP